MKQSLAPLASVPERVCPIIPLSAGCRQQVHAAWATAVWSRVGFGGKPLTPASIHPADLIELDDGRVLLVVGNRAGPLGVTGLISDRQQHFDWSRRFTLVDDAFSTDCGYPRSVKLPGGRALTLYYATRAKEHPQWGVHCGAVAYDVPAAP